MDRRIGNFQFLLLGYVEREKCTSILDCNYHYDAKIIWLLRTLFCFAMQK